MDGIPTIPRWLAYSQQTHKYQAVNQHDQWRTKNMVERTVQGDPQKWDVNHALTQERDQHDPPQNPPRCKNTKKKHRTKRWFVFQPLGWNRLKQTCHGDMVIVKLVVHQNLMVKVKMTSSCFF